ncbi:MAG TPA: hypothetical protein DEG44_05795 [Candidatus Kerfeldbacteria bacterium]|nr:hypothetical protein [Candidatus Kerfeldbacteria bacterium]
MQVVIFDFYGVIYNPLTSQPTAGLREFVELLNAQAVHCGVASSTQSSTIETFLQEHGLDSYFPVVIGSDKVTRIKPDPECYRAVAKAYTVQPADCIVIDDSLDAVAEAKQAGFETVFFGNDLDSFEKIATLLKL